MRAIVPGSQHVPLLRIPCAGRPPTAACSPRSIGSGDFEEGLCHRGMPQASSHATRREPARAASCAARPCGRDLASVRLPSVEKPSIRKLPARCVSSSTGEPTRSSPTMALSRASVTSSREGSGICGANRPSCTLRDCPASAESASETTAAGGGCAPISSCSNFSRNLRSVVASAGRIAPCACVRHRDSCRMKATPATAPVPMPALQGSQSCARR